ncbi:type II secretion system F family protein [Actinopolyspora xinjiangensis]|nr:type II secretion system F family protein [Actinopolyspora xinjiangensis]
MVPVAIALVSAAVLLGMPDRLAANRLAGLRGRGEPALRQWPRLVVPVLGSATTVLLTSLAGVAVALAAVLLGWLALRHRRWRARAARRLRMLHALVVGLRVLVGELEAGAHPATAAESAAADSCSEETRVLFAELASTVRLGGSPTDDFGAVHLPAETRRDASRIARRWRLAERHGIPLARLLETVRVDLDHRLRTAREVEAKLAGPRATAAVLLVLPVLGLVLGQLSGAGALAVLTTDQLGRIMLLVGVGLLCAGVLWIQRLTESGAEP